jgi:PhnB protein
MAQMYPYLTFSGNCREALVFYQQCMGGQLRMMTVGESPLSDQMPDTMKDCILHATLDNSLMSLTGTDLLEESGQIIGNNLSLLINCSSEQEANIYFKNLSQGGQITCPLQVNYWGLLFGTLTDQFGIQWIISHLNLRQAAHE